MYKLLIVDDEPLVQVGIKSMLNWAELNIEVTGTAVNGQAALKLIEEQSPDIVITDIKMPVMSGLELIRICRERYGHRLSGKAGADSRNPSGSHRPCHGENQCIRNKNCKQRGHSLPLL